ncbi:hypothetical protein AC579_8532 [Pseudocercospora musae]|uniref:Uncharacterized protein n=1 Tax=Pseudocercospora musae TaxID=113226 RepID=A0A139GT92_9PEZI|nr:hypothetical protein AC579_8532 [Pseudocercospora musae]
MARASRLATRSATVARLSELQIQASLDQKYQKYCLVRDALKEMELDQDVLGAPVEEPTRRIGRSGPWRKKALVELGEELDIMTRLHAAVLHGAKLRDKLEQKPSQQPGPPTATPPSDHPPSLVHSSARTARSSTSESAHVAPAATLQMHQQVEPHRLGYGQQQHYGYPSNNPGFQPVYAEAAAATLAAPYKFGTDTTPGQQQHQQSTLAAPYEFGADTTPGQQQQQQQYQPEGAFKPYEDPQVLGGNGEQPATDPSDFLDIFEDFDFDFSLGFSDMQGPMPADAAASGLANPHGFATDTAHDQQQQQHEGEDKNASTLHEDAQGHAGND